MLHIKNLSTSRKAPNMILLPLKPLRMTCIMVCSTEVLWQVLEPKAYLTSLIQITSPTSLIPMGNDSLKSNKILFFSVLIKIIQTDFGRSLVRQDDQHYDAQVVLWEVESKNCQFPTSPLSFSPFPSREGCTAPC